MSWSTCSARNKTFRVTRERVSSKLGKALGATNDVKTGDQAFDDLFVIDTDEKLARAVLRRLDQEASDPPGAGGQREQPTWGWAAWAS